MGFKVKIESRQDYELHVTKVIEKLDRKDATKAVLLKFALKCFDDGLTFNQGNLSVEVS